MLLKLDEFKKVCSTIATAVDSGDLSKFTDTLELRNNGNYLQLNVTNKEYFVTVNSYVGEGLEEFRACVNASLFLKLISQTTTEDIELTIDKNSLVVRGNGTYKLPLIFEGYDLLELPRIEIENKTVEMNVDSEILRSILTYNSKQLNIGTITAPIQRLHYVDQDGALTFTTGACINRFKLDKDVKMLLPNKIVKLFKLFEAGAVKLELGIDLIPESDIYQTKAKFSNDNIEITAILSSDDTMVNAVPVDKIRRWLDVTYPYSVSLSKDLLLQTLNRMQLLSTLHSNIINPVVILKFKGNELTVFDMNRENNEVITFNSKPIDGEYEFTIYLNDLKLTLETCSESYFTLSFGDKMSIRISRLNIYNILSECTYE